jgi:hypothetical protein
MEGECNIPWARNLPARATPPDTKERRLRMVKLLTFIVVDDWVGLGY